MELVQTLALLQKPIVLSIPEDDKPEKCSDVIANAINATRIFGYTQIIWSYPTGGRSIAELDKEKIQEKVALLQKIVNGMALKDEIFLMTHKLISDSNIRIGITLEQKSS